MQPDRTSGTAVSGDAALSSCASYCNETSAGALDVGKCHSFSVTLVVFDPATMQFVHPLTDGATDRASTTAATAHGMAVGYTRPRHYVDVARTASGRGVLGLPAGLKYPAPINAAVSLGEGPQLELEGMQFHLLSPTLVVCRAMKNAVANPNSSISTLMGTTGRAGNDTWSETTDRRSETEDVVFGLQFSDASSASSFLEAVDTRHDAALRSRGKRATETTGSSAYTCSHLNTMEPSSLATYFQYYSRMSNQVNMLQDSARTTAYQQAVLRNSCDFADKVIMDVGAGSGILSFFAANAGAKRVYAVEASNMADVIRLLCEGNPEIGSRMVIINKTVESITAFDVPEKVDVLISEPLGTFLFNERMIESYLFARDHFLKPQGRMFPSRAALYLCPFTDEQLHADLEAKASFWLQTNFFGVDLSTAAPRALQEAFKQPVVDYVDPKRLVGATERIEFDFTSIRRDSLEEIRCSFGSEFTSSALVHGLASWFVVMFDGSQQRLWFSTGPEAPPTHWFQTRIVLPTPLAVNTGQKLLIDLHLRGNVQQSYLFDVTMRIDGTNFEASTSDVDLKDPDYRYFTCPGQSFYPHKNAELPMFRVEPADTKNYLP